jgi:hypothetical protein
MYLYPGASGFLDEWIVDAGLPHTPADVLRQCARLCACDLAPRHPRRHMRAPSVGVDRVRFGSQAFNSASAFNANIGAWNTARVIDLRNVCAALVGPERRATAGGTRSAGRRCGSRRRAWRDRRCARACLRRRAGTRMRGRPRVQALLRVRKKDSMYVCICMDIYILYFYV